MENMSRKDGWTKHVRYAKRTQRVRQDKWTRQGDMLMSPVFKIPPTLLEISSPDSSQDDQSPKSYTECVCFCFFL